MKKPTPLQNVLSVTERKERDAALIVAQVKQRLEAERQRVEKLEYYYNEYRQRQFAGGHSSNPALVRNYALFMRQMQSAVEEQRRKFVKVESDLAKALQNWKKINDKVTGITQLLDNLATQALALENKLEQMMLDDWNGRQQAFGEHRKE